MNQIRYILPVTISMGLLLVFSDSSIGAAKEAMELCANSLIPSLFPFFVFSNLLVNLGAANILSKLFTPLMKPLFGLNGSCSLAIIMGYISGYPVGAKTAADLYINGSCLKHEAEKMLAFCNNCGPMFIIGAVGSGMIGDSSVGVMLYISHILSSLTVAFIMRSFTVCHYPTINSPQNKSSTGFGEIFSDAVSSSVILTLTVCGFVIIFGLVISFIEKAGIINAISSLGIDYSLLKAVIYGFFECSGGCKNAITASKSPLITYMLLSSVMAWSGISVHLQVLGIIKKAKLSPKLYFKGKALMAIISPVITMFIYGFKSGKLKIISFMHVAVLLSVAIFTVVKTVSVIKRFYFKYSAQPPR